jgi:hypothetical protein
MHTSSSAIIDALFELLLSNIHTHYHHPLLLVSLQRQLLGLPLHDSHVLRIFGESKFKIIVLGESEECGELVLRVYRFEESNLEVFDGESGRQEVVEHHDGGHAVGDW